MNAPADGRLPTRLGASLGLAAYSAVVAASFIRVFEDWAFLGDMVVLIIVGHGTSILLRRVYLFITLPVQVMVLTWLLTVLRYPDTMRGGLPGSATWRALTEDLAIVREQFADAVAPVPFTNGWAAIAVVGMALTVLLSDVFAFRARTRFEALVPGGVLFVIVGALGSGRDQIITAMLMVVAGVVAVATLRVHQLRPARVLVGRRSIPAGKILIGALPIGLLAAGVAGAFGPSLPGADSDALYEPIGGDGSTIRSPLVDIRSRLVDQSGTELFRVEASESAYWRLTTLSEFNGVSWQLPERTVRDAGDSLGTAVPGSRIIRQNIEIGALGGRLVPAAAEPIGAQGQGLRWNQDSATLLTGEDGYSRGERFIVESAAPTFSPGQLAGSRARNGPDDEFVELPVGLPDVVGATATDVTAGAGSDYERARALQDWFRSEFTYSLEVQDGHGNDAIEQFLELRIGYCEQFAGTFAAMARELGMPARVAVGYTPGTVDDSGAFSVAGRNAHAWPEVWFEDFGWVPFEPTPGRGNPGTEDYTGVPPQQAEPGNDPADGQTPATTVPTEPADSRPATDPNADLPPGLLDGGPGQIDPDEFGASGAAGESGSPDGPSGPLIALGVIGGLLALLITVPAAIRHIRRRRWRDHPRDAIAQLWVRLGRLMAAGGVHVDPSRTPSELATVAARTAPGAATEIRSLASVLDRCVYGPDEVDASQVTQCKQWYEAVERSMANLIPASQRVWRYLTSLD